MSSFIFFFFRLETVSRLYCNQEHVPLGNVLHLVLLSNNGFERFSEKVCFNQMKSSRIGKFGTNIWFQVDGWDEDIEVVGSYHYSWLDVERTFIRSIHFVCIMTSSIDIRFNRHSKTYNENVKIEFCRQTLSCLFFPRISSKAQWLFPLQHPSNIMVLV